MIFKNKIVYRREKNNLVLLTYFQIINSYFELNTFIDKVNYSEWYGIYIINKDDSAILFISLLFVCLNYFVKWVQEIFVINCDTMSTLKSRLINLKLYFFKSDLLWNEAFTSCLGSRCFRAVQTISDLVRTSTDIVFGFFFTDIKDGGVKDTSLCDNEGNVTWISNNVRLIMVNLRGECTEDGL